MKIFVSTVKVPVHWTFACDHQTLRSTIIGGYQAEIYKGHLKIINAHGTTHSEFVGTRSCGMKRGTLILSRLLRKTQYG